MQLPQLPQSCTRMAPKNIAGGMAVSSLTSNMQPTPSQVSVPPALEPYVLGQPIPHGIGVLAEGAGLHRHPEGRLGQAQA